MSLVITRPWSFGVVGDDPVTRRTTATASYGFYTVSVNHVPGSSFTPGYVNPTYASPTTTIGSTPKARVLSEESGIAPFETLFHDFELQANPVYNFWEKDEESASPVRGNQELVDLGRYIHLTWNQAPDVRDPDEYKKRALVGQLADAYDQFTELSPFGFGSHAVVGHTVNGVAFTPENLQPSHFRENAARVANGYIASGIVGALVSVPVHALATPPAPSSQLVDEDAYLADYRRWQGIPYPEFNAALWRRRSVTYGAQQLGTAYGINPPNVYDQGMHLVTSGNPNAAISYYGRAATSQRQQFVSRIEELTSDYLTILTQPMCVHTVKASFIHTNYAGVFAPARASAATQPHHAESIIAVAQHAPDLAAYARSGYQHYSHDLSIPSDPAPSTIKAVEYIGYVIEKWEMVDGAYKLVDTFYIPGREYDAYDDTQVKYGSSYRYRIRGIARWCRARGMGVMGPEQAAPAAPGSLIATLTPNVVSYFHSEWGHDWSYAQVIDRTPPDPPDELIVQPCSSEKKVVVSFRLPYNPQRDINKMTLYRKLQDHRGRDLTGWVQVQEFLEDLSDPSRQGTRHLFSAQAVHEQDDITGTKFDIVESERTERFVEYGPTNARFEDRDVEYWGGAGSACYVYAARCFTRHGEGSTLSDQMAVRLNPDWKKTGELPLKLVSSAGVHPDFDTGMFGTRPERRVRSELVCVPDPRTGAPAKIGAVAQVRKAKRQLGPSSYVLRVESLDTGEHVDLPVDLSVRNLPTEIQTLPYTALVAAQE